MMEPKVFATCYVTERGFPPPWSVEEQEACYPVRDHDGQQLAYVDFEDEPGRYYQACTTEEPPPRLPRFSRS